VRALAVSPAVLMRRYAQGLTKLLSDNAKACVREVKFESYFGRKVAIDASMHIYQFMVRVRRVHSTSALGAFAPRRSARPRARSLRAQAVVGRQGDMQLTNEAGEVTRCVLFGCLRAHGARLTCAPRLQPPAGHVQPHRAHPRRRHPPHVRARRRLARRAACARSSALRLR
jgi:hypothetical protein